jgi:hypothetical protein
MKTLQDQYNLIKKGLGHKGVFLNEAKLRYPNLLRPAATFEEAVKTLNSKNIIKENIYYPQVLGNEGGTQKESWELKFSGFLNEEEENIKADAKKTDKSVEDALANAYDSSDLENLDNLSFQQLLKGVYFEAQQTPDKSLEDLIKIVGKNLAKDQLHYVKNGQFGMDGVGYETQKSDEVSGKSASSGFGEKTVDKKEPKELKEDLNYSQIGEETLDDMTEEDLEEEQKEPKKTTKVKKETLETRLAAIEREGAAVTLEAKIQHLQTEMDTKNERLNMIGENQDLADLVDGKKLKEMQREIKVLGKRNDKLKKMYEKMTGKAYVQQEIVDEAEDGVEEGKAKTYDEKLADDDKKRKGFTPQKVETEKPGSPIQERRLIRRK